MSGVRNPFEVGRIVGPYEIVRELGRGGMGRVYLAHDTAVGGRYVAIKVILAGDPDDDGAKRARFVREIRNLARLRHPNIVTVLTAGEHQGHPYFVMDYIAGRDLSRFMDECAVMPERQRIVKVVRLLRSVARAVHYAHGKQLIHRDLKPANILITYESDEPIILDFGIAKFIGDSSLTRGAESPGTPAYRAPEQIDIRLLKAMLAKAVSWDMLDTNPAASVKPFAVSNQRLRYLTTEELAALETAAAADVATWLAPAITLAVNLGLRRGELLRLRWRDLRPEQHLAAIEQTKSNEPRYVPLNATVKAVLATLPRYGETILASPWGEPIAGTTLYAAFQRACTAAKIVDCRWHDLRHTFASHCVMAGVDLATVKELLGHHSLEMTMRYSHLAPAQRPPPWRSSPRP
jgi:integrase